MVLLGFTKLRSKISVSIIVGCDELIEAGKLKFNLHFADIKKHKSNVDECRCQCLPHLATFREDLNICVDDIHGEFYVLFVELSPYCT